LASDKKLISLYNDALKRVVARGWDDEVQYFRQLTFEKVDGRFFFREYVFCVYVAGWSWSNVDLRWNRLEKCFRKWDYKQVSSNSAQVRDEALTIINHEKKTDAILQCATKLSSWGWARFRDWLQGYSLLVPPRQLGYIGPAVRYHLARNIGADVAKPDRYMLNLAAKNGYPPTDPGVQQFAKRISVLTGERVGVVDYVLWRDYEGSSYIGSPRIECKRTQLKTWLA